MKKVFSLLLIAVMLFANCSVAFALKSGVNTFSITPIRPNFKDKYIKINITAPGTQTNSKMLVAFYIENKLTALTPLDISSTAEFKLKQINTYKFIETSSANYYKDLTPNKIEIFTWDKTTLKPKTLCDNVLTPDVIKAANADVVESLSIIPEATEHIRNFFLVWEEDVEDGLAETWDEHLFAIMDHLDACAEQAAEDAETHLMTSLYAQSQYYDDLSQIRKLANNLTAQEQETMNDILSGTLDPSVFPTKYYNALNNSMKFLDFSLSDIYS